MAPARWGAAGLVIAEASAVSREGRITAPPDAGIWSDAHAQAWTPIAAFVKHYAFPGIQIAHAGRKGSANRTPSCATGRPISSLLAELSDPHWPCHAAQVLGLANPEHILPPQYAHWMKSRTRNPD